MSQGKYFKSFYINLYSVLPRLSHSRVSIDQLASLDVVGPIDVMGSLIGSRLGLTGKGARLLGFFPRGALYAAAKCVTPAP